MAAHKMLGVAHTVGGGKLMVNVGLLVVFAVLSWLTEVDVVSKWVFVLLIGLLALISTAEIFTVTDDSFLSRKVDAFVGCLVLVVLCGAGILSYAWATGSHWFFYAVVLGSVMSDSAAQICGKLWKLLPAGGHWRRIKRRGESQPQRLRSISASKSYVGYVTGLVVGGVTVYLVLRLAGRLDSWWLIALIPLLAEIGDLLASWLKRLVDVKDYTLWHLQRPLLGYKTGGIYDRGDSHFFAATVAGLTYFFVSTL